LSQRRSKACSLPALPAGIVPGAGTATCSSTVMNCRWAESPMRIRALRATLW